MRIKHIKKIKENVPKSYQDVPNLKIVYSVNDLNNKLNEAKKTTINYFLRYYTKTAILLAAVKLLRIGYVRLCSNVS